MPEPTTLLAFALIVVGMVLTPGPNMIYLISRSLSQGPMAGLISLGGVALGFVFYALAAAFGITAIVFAVPTPMTRCASAARSTCSGWPGRRSGPADARPSRCGS